MRTPVFFSLLVAALVGLSPTAHTATLKAWEDTCSTKGKITLASNKTSTMVIGASRNGFIYFDLTEIPNGAVVRYARLRLYFPSVSRAGLGVTLHAVTSEWNEGVEGNAPTFVETPVATFAPEALGSKRFASTDVTETVRGWIADRASNQGFALVAVPGSPGTPDALLTVSAKEGGGTGYPAELEVELLNPGDGSGEISNEQLPANLNLAGVTTGNFSGNGAGLTNLASTAMKLTEPGAGTVARTIQAKLEDQPLSAKDFGAVANGVADDTVSLQAALDAANLQHRPLYISPGIYKITDVLRIPAGSMKIIGAGGQNTTIRQTVSGKSAMIVASNSNQVTVEGIRLRGNGQGIHTAPGFVCPPSGNCVDDLILRDVSIEEFGVGAELQDVANSLLERVSFFQNGVGGLRVWGNSNAITYLDCSWVENTGYGVRLDGGRGHVIVTGDFGGPKQTGSQVIMGGATTCTVTGTNMEVYGGDAIDHQTTGTSLLLENVFIHDFNPASAGYSVVTGMNTTQTNSCMFGRGVSGAQVRQNAVINSNLIVHGAPLKVMCFNGETLRGTFQTNPLVTRTECGGSGLGPSAFSAGIVLRRMDSNAAGVGSAEFWNTALRNADGSYDFVSLTPLRTANTWPLAQTFSQRAAFPAGLSAATIRMDGQGAAPAGPTEGQIYFNSTDKHFYGWDGTTWKQLDN